MNDEYRLRFLVEDMENSDKSARFVYRPPNCGPPMAQDAVTGVKFAQYPVILDDWWLFGGTRWSRTRFRLKHPIIYSKRGLRSLWRRIKHIFVKPKMIQPLLWHREWITREEAAKIWPNKQEESDVLE